MSIAALKNGLNNLYADRISDVSARTVGTYGKESWSAIKSALEKWEAEGSLKVIADPEKVDPEQQCVKLFSFIK